MASSLHEAKQIINDELSYKPHIHSYKDVAINDIEISSHTNVSDLSASLPCNMQMKTASYKNHNNGDACEDFDKKVRPYVIDNLQVYIVHL